MKSVRMEGTGTFGGGGGNDVFVGEKNRKGKEI